MEGGGWEAALALSAGNWTEPGKGELTLTTAPLLGAVSASSSFTSAFYSLDVCEMFG